MQFCYIGNGSCNIFIIQIGIDVEDNLHGETHLHDRQNQYFLIIYFQRMLYDHPR